MRNSRGRSTPQGFASPVAFVQDPTDRAVQFVVEQGGRIRVVRNGTVLGLIFSTSPAASRAAASKGCSASRSRPITPRAAASTSTSRTPPATPSSRVSTDRANPRRRRSLVEVRPAAGQPAAIIEQPYCESQRRTSGVRTRRLSVYRSRRRRLGQRSRASRAEPERTPRQDAAHRRQRRRRAIRSATGFRPTIRSSGRAVRAMRSGHSACATPGATASTMSHAGRNGRAGHRRRRPEQPGGNRLRAARRRRPQLWLAQSRGHAWRRHDLTYCSAVLDTLTDPIFEYGRGDGVSVTGGFVYRGARLARLSRTLFLRGLLRTRLVARAHDRGAGEARASDRREHTAELGGSHARNDQLVRRRCRRRALHRQSLQRQDHSHHRAARRSLRPTGLKIINP